MSATPWNALDVLERCVPLLAGENATFKVAASPERLAELNQGAGGAAQAGKFVTVYPDDDGQAVRLARQLDEATAGMRGPKILSDRPLSPSSLVHYRYADFVVEAGEGDEPPARRIDVADRPDDPFVAAGLAPEPAPRLVASRYLITANLHRSVRGAVHLAVDAKERRSCVLKRAWRDGALMPDGTDARDRLRDEAQILQRFEGDDHFPAVWDLVEDELDLFLVMEHVAGRTFAEVVHEMHGRGDPPDAATVIRWGIELAAALERIHSEDLVHRDLNPVNVIVGDEGRVCVIDFELVRRVGTRADSYGAGTAGYMSPGQAAAEPASILDDIYALGALLFLAATGSDPEQDEGNDAALRDVQPGLREVIEASLSFEEGRAPSATHVRADLERALRS